MMQAIDLEPALPRRQVIANLSKQEQTSPSLQEPATRLLQIPKDPSGANDELKHWNAPVREPQDAFRINRLMDKCKLKNKDQIAFYPGEIVFGFGFTSAT
jgi:hypothetical protein